MINLVSKLLKTVKSSSHDYKHEAPSTVHLSRRYSHSTKSPYKPIMVVLSHLDHEWEQQAFFSFHQELIRLMGFEHTPSIDVFAAHGSSRHLNNEAVWSLRHNQNEYSAVVTIGALTSVAIAEACKTWNLAIPQLFVAVPDPAGLGVLAIDNSARSEIGGVSMVLPSFENQVSFLKDMRDKGERVLLPYDARHSAPLYQGLADEFASQEYTVSPLPLYPHTDIDNAVGSQLSSYDVLCMTNDSPLMIHSQHVVDVCNKKGVTLFSSNLTAVRRGAAIGFGTIGSVYGQSAAELMTRHFQEGVPFKKLGVMEVVESAEIRFNPYTLAQQRITPPKIVSQALGARSIYANAEW